MPHLIFSFSLAKFLSMSFVQGENSVKLLPDQFHSSKVVKQAVGVGGWYLSISLLDINESLILDRIYFLEKRGKYKI